MFCAILFSILHGEGQCSLAQACELSLSAETGGMGDGLASAGQVPMLLAAGTRDEVIQFHPAVELMSLHCSLASCFTQSGLNGFWNSIRPPCEKTPGENKSGRPDLLPQPHPLMRNGMTHSLEWQEVWANGNRLRGSQMHHSGLMSGSAPTTHHCPPSCHAWRS